MSEINEQMNGYSHFKLNKLFVLILPFLKRLEISAFFKVPWIKFDKYWIKQKPPNLSRQFTELSNYAGMLDKPNVSQKFQVLNISRKWGKLFTD